MAKIMKLGTLCFGGQPMIGMPKYGGERLSIGDSVPGKEIHWVSARGLLVADRCICVNISWGQLLDFGFLFGTRIRIDGKSYTCRCLMGGEGPLCPNEWDDLRLARTTKSGIGNPNISGARKLRRRLVLQAV